MAKIVRNILETVGGTPLVALSAKMNPTAARVLVKIEAFNPGGSQKDRAAISMVEAAERDGLLRPGSTIVEPTSGNTGIGLAIAAAVRGYHLVLTMPDTMSVERRRLAAAYGAEVVLTPGDRGMAGAIEKADEIAAERGGFIPQQFENSANAAAHERTTGPEIWSGCDGVVDVFVASVGTGGTLTGTGRYLKSKNPSVRLVAVEPDTSAVLSGKPAGSHRLQGIGAGFVPKVLDRSLINEVIAVSDTDAGAVARALAAKEGILAGISSGATLHAALEVARRPESDGKTIVALLPDTGERYLSTWLFAEN